MANRRLETEYLLVDLIPIAAFFAVGLIILAVTGIAECCSHYKKPFHKYCTTTSCKDGKRCSKCEYRCTKLTRRLSSFLINMLYGDGTQLVGEPSNQEDNTINIQGHEITSDDRCLYAAVFHQTRL